MVPMMKLVGMNAERLEYIRHVRANLRGLLVIGACCAIICLLSAWFLTYHSANLLATYIFVFCAVGTFFGLMALSDLLFDKSLRESCVCQ